LAFRKALHYEADLTGIVMLSDAGFGVIVSPFAGRWIDRTHSSKAALIVGAVTAIAGTLLLLTVRSDTSPVYLFAVLSILGCSNGFNNLGLQTALYSFVWPEETGIASGLFMTSRYLGTILSSSLLGILFGSKVTTAQFHIVAAVGAVLPEGDRMQEQPIKEWMKVIPEEEQHIYKRAGFLEKFELGERMALLVVDVTYGFTGSESLTLEEAMQEFPTACGPASWEAVPKIAGLIELFRNRQLPVVFTLGDPYDAEFAGGAVKSKRKLDMGGRYNDFPEQIAPLED
jgi:MFS family permease